jgi:hypothetical protein
VHTLVSSEHWPAQERGHPTPIGISQDDIRLRRQRADRVAHRRA